MRSSGDNERSDESLFHIITHPVHSLVSAARRHSSVMKGMRLWPCCAMHGVTWHQCCVMTSAVRWPCRAAKK
ncbi:hypothetical protein HAX54_019063, partial [Datura stramonium]|nr:hypothetical protein [Datura stramonium]